MKISVIIPVYNAEKYLEKAVLSALQLEEVFEVVLVEDHSPDQAFEICKKLEAEHSRVKLFTHPNHENRGAGASRNLGIEKATGDYIAFLDADDFFLPNRFEKDKVIFEKNYIADGCYNAIGCSFYSEKAKAQFLEKFSSEITTVNPNTNPTPENLFAGLLGMIPNYGYFSLNGLTLKRKTLIASKVKFNQLRIHQDTDFNIRISYVLNLFPSEISNPVALRGVHEENRITANFQQIKTKQFYNRFLMWRNLEIWAKEANVPSLEKNQIIQNRIYNELLSKENPKFLFFLKKIIEFPSILKHRNYSNIHKIYMGNIPYNHFIFKIRNFAIKFL